MYHGVLDGVERLVWHLVREVRPLLRFLLEAGAGEPRRDVFHCDILNDETCNLAREREERRTPWELIDEERAWDGGLRQAFEGTLRNGDEFVCAVLDLDTVCNVHYRRRERSAHMISSMQGIKRRRE